MWLRCSKCKDAYWLKVFGQKSLYWMFVFPYNNARSNVGPTLNQYVQLVVFAGICMPLLCTFFQINWISWVQIKICLWFVLVLLFNPQIHVKMNPHCSTQAIILGHICHFKSETKLGRWDMVITMSGRTSVFRFRTISRKPVAGLFSYCIHTSLRGYGCVFWGLWPLTFFLILRRLLMSDEKFCFRMIS